MFSSETVKLYVLSKKHKIMFSCQNSNIMETYYFSFFVTRVSHIALELNPDFFFLVLVDFQIYYLNRIKSLIY